MKYFLKEKVINYILGNENFKDYVSSIISAVIDVPYEDVFNNLNYNSNKSDDNVTIEINYNCERGQSDKNTTYMWYLKHMVLEKKDQSNSKIQININSYDIFNRGDFIYKSTIRNEKYNIVRSNLIQIYDINIDYLANLSEGRLKKVKNSSLEKMIYILICKDREKRYKLCKGDKLLERINNELRRIVQTSELYIDLGTFYNRESREIGYREGIELGKIEGVDEGLREGYIIGEKEMIKRLSSCMTKKRICEFLDISLE